MGIVVEDLTVAFDGGDVLHGVDLDVPDRQIVALLGPSGCGKTTLLRTIAGLERPRSGRVVIGGTEMSGPGSFVPAERRRLGMVFQDWALFPHLSVAGNVAFGLPRKERKGPRVAAALEMVGLEGFGDRMPGTLSGGQQQRVAIARALAPEPSALLLDEPFSNLDTSLRARVRTEVHELLHRVGITSVFVTHDQDEAFVLGDQVAVMSGGRIAQQDSPARLYSDPVSPWVARFVGDANMIPGESNGTRVTTTLGSLPIRSSTGSPVPTGDVQVLLRPEDLRVVDEDQGAVVRLVEYYGHDTVYEISVGAGTAVKVREVGVPRFTEGASVAVRVTGNPVPVFDAS